MSELAWVMLPITNEAMENLPAELLAPRTERWVNDWCADNGYVRLEGPPQWREVDHYAGMALIWPALTP